MVRRDVLRLVVARRVRFLCRSVLLCMTWFVVLRYSAVSHRVSLSVVRSNVPLCVMWRSVWFRVVVCQ